MQKHDLNPRRETQPSCVLIGEQPRSAYVSFSDDKKINRISFNFTILLAAMVQALVVALLHSVKVDLMTSLNSALSAPAAVAELTVREDCQHFNPG